MVLGNRILVLPVLIPLIALSCNIAVAQRGPAVVEVTPVIKRDVLMTQTTVGTVTPSRRAVIGSAVDGRVVEFLVREGDRVEKDQPLAKLLTQTIEWELAAAEAELELKRQELAELENGSRPDELAQAKARMEATRIAAEYREKDRERALALGGTSVLSESELEDTLSRFLAAKQQHLESEAAYRLAVEGPRPERILQAKAEVRMREAVVNRLTDQIAKHTMYSRFAGYVTVEHTEVGQWVSRGEPVAEVIALDEVEIEVRVVEQHIPFIHVGQSVQVQVPALGRETFTGTVASVVPQADVRSRTFPVKVLVSNRITAAGEPLLKSGMLARVEMPTDSSVTPILVPKDALVLRGESAAIWVIDPASIQKTEDGMISGDAIFVPVTTGVEEGALIEVNGNLQADMNVVVRGNERIPPTRPGQPPSKVVWRASNS